jgi:type I restriction enzyme, S subunit
MPDSVSLDDLVDLRRGTTYKGLLVAQPGPALLGLGSIQRHGGFKADGLQSYGGDCPESILVRPGELYVSLKDVTHSGDLLGAVARVPLTLECGRLTQDTVALKLKDGRLDASYLYWMLRTPQYRAYCRERATGTTNLGLPRTDFLAYRLPLPDENRLALVRLLDALDDKIAANSRTRTLIDRLLEASYQLAISRGSVISDVGSIAEFHNRRRVPLSARDRELRPGSVPYYGASGVFGYVDEAIFDSHLVLVGEDGSVINRTAVRLFSTSGGPRG